MADSARPRRYPRRKPFLGGTVAADVGAAFAARVARDGGRASHVLETVLRAGLAALGDLATNDDNEGAPPAIRVG